jgi:hypothetical protein
MAEAVATSSWLPVATLLIGYLTKSVSEWVQYRRASARERMQHEYTSEREREARDALRRDQLFERRNTFQRQTLLDLQENLTLLGRTIGEMSIHDRRAYRETSEWQKQLYGDDLAERNRVAQARTGMLGVRVRRIDPRSS